MSYQGEPSTEHNGWFREISFACNNYAPPQLWRWLHEPGNREAYLRELLKELGLRPENGDCLGTGVDMDNVVVKTMEYSQLYMTLSPP